MSSMAVFCIFSFPRPSDWSDKHGQERFLYQGECRESCPVGHYPAKGHACMPCPDNCELCYNPHVCSRCMSGYFIVATNHTCQRLECGQGEASAGSYSAPGRGVTDYTSGTREAWTTLQPIITVLLWTLRMTLNSSVSKLGCRYLPFALPRPTTPRQQRKTEVRISVLANSFLLLSY